jgi:hypothetical protein
VNLKHTLIVLYHFKVKLQWLPDVVPLICSVLVTGVAAAVKTYGKVATLLAVNASGGFCKKE